MNNKELIAKYAEKMGITKKAAGEQMEGFVETITEALVEHAEAKVSGLGTFSVVERPEREGRNPATGETIVIKATKAPKFKAAKFLKDTINA